MSDPFWFQAFGCVLGFDWHSSGVTTTVCGAVKESLRETGTEWGLFAAGGKGAASRRSPAQITGACDALGRDPSALLYASRTAAKVDNAAVQDGYQLYHHVFLFTASGEPQAGAPNGHPTAQSPRGGGPGAAAALGWQWCVVQQGMNNSTSTARRYHWLSEHVTSFVDEPHEAICCDVRRATLNLVASESTEVRRTSTELACLRPQTTLEAIEKVPDLRLPTRHGLFPEIDVDTRYLSKILLKTYERALALASELIYSTQASTRDPARFAFAHGGKDGIPFPVDRETYDRTIDVLGRAVDRARIDRSEKIRALKRLAHFRM